MKINLKERGKKILLLIDGIKEGLFPRKLLKDIKEGESKEEERLRIIEEIIIPYAKEIVLRNLALRDRTEKEIMDILKRKEFSDETIKRVIDDFKNVNLIDDLKTARYIVQNTKGKSKNEIKFKLKNMGIKDEDIEEILKDYDEVEALKLEIMKGKKKYKDVKKLFAYLLRKGFDYDEIKRMIGRIDEEY